MLFNSVDYLIFFPIVVGIYFIVPKRVRYLVLLIASYYFYMCWNPKYALLIAASTVITYACGILIDKTDSTKLKKLLIVLNCVSNLGILFVFKYANWLIDNISKIMSMAGFNAIEKRFDLLLPVGISFYTFQALSYTFDVYKKTIKPERNILKYALYVSFFPQLVAGPIERSTKLLPQVQNADKINVWEFDRVRDGFLIMLWGYFQKLVIADRISLYVEPIVNNYTEYGSIEIILAVVLFAFQIYCDFGGYSNIARGAAKVMGFELMQNFKEPYLATDIKSFWRRWHISLTSWFTDYLYIPLGGNRKGELRKYINIFIVFGISGLWHGASWNYVAWGLLHAIYQVVGQIKDKLAGKSGKTDNVISRIGKILITFILTDFAWLFFVSKGLRNAVLMIRRIVTSGNISADAIQEFGTQNCIILLVALIILAIVDILHEKQISVFSLVQDRNVVVRWIVYYALLWLVIIYGIYGPAYDSSTFIYFQF